MNALTGLTTAMALAVPIIVFGFLYVLRVQPERARAAEAETQLDAALTDLHRGRLSSSAPADMSDAAALERFTAREGSGDRVNDVVDALDGLFSSSVVGDVANLRIDAGASSGQRTPVSLTFDAPHEQIVRFFRALGGLPAFIGVESVEIAPSSPAGLKRANVSLVVLHVPEATSQSVPEAASRTDANRPPRSTPERLEMPPRRVAVARPSGTSPARPDPRVSGILIAGGRRVARVDGRIVRPGDRVGDSSVQSIEPGAIFIVDLQGRARRIEIQRGAVGMGPR